MARTRFLLIFAGMYLAAGSLSNPYAHAQEVTQVSIPVEDMSCLVAHQDEYLGLPRNVIIFFAEACPAVSRREVAEWVQNSADEGESAVRLILLKEEFRCLVRKIEDRLDASPEEGGDSDGIVTFSLDCG